MIDEPKRVELEEQNPEEWARIIKWLTDLEMRLKKLECRADSIEYIIERYT